MNDDLRARFDALADRGEPRGAEAVISAARAEALARIGTTREDRTMTDHDIPAVDDLVAEPSAPRPRPRRTSRGIAGLGLAALLGVGGYAAISAQGGGGARSPEAAVEQLAEAISAEDPLAAIDVLAPREVRSLERSVKLASSKAEQLELVEDAADPFAGFDLEVEGLETEVTELAPGFAKVTITDGIVTGSLDPSGLAARFRDAEAGEPGEIDLRDADGAGDWPFVVAVKDGDGWYVSPAYTAFEYARESYEVDHDTTIAVDYGAADAADLGADDPETAVRDAFAAIEAGDWERLLELAPPGELPLWEYRELVLAAAEEGSDVVVDRLDVEVDTDGDQATARIDAAGTSGDDTTWRIGGECSSQLLVSGDLSDDGSGSSLCLAGQGRAAVPLGIFVASSTAADSGPLEVRLVREDGRWFVSPVGTVLGALDSWIDTFDADSIAALTGDYAAIEPDGTLVLGEELAIPSGGPYVYTFEAAAGTELSALAGESTSVLLVGPDGEELENGYGLGYGEPVRLGEAGEYRLVVWSYGAASTLTVFEGGVEALPVQGVIELGTAIDVPAGGPHVFTVTGTAGQEIIGQGGDELGDVRVYGPDGEDLGAYGLLWGQSLVLPADGEYRVVVRSYAGASTLTLWNLADAPDDLVEGGGFGGPTAGPSEMCTTEGDVMVCTTYDADGNVTGTSTSTLDGATATTMSIGPATTVAAANG